jgi:hypothetical protein
METQFQNKFTPIPNCQKCGGTGWKTKKKTKVEGKQKPCKACIKACGYCPKCNNTGEVPGKPIKYANARRTKLKKIKTIQQKKRKKKNN